MAPGLLGSSQSRGGQGGGHFSPLFGLSPKGTDLLAAALSCLCGGAGPGPPPTAPGCPSLGSPIGDTVPRTSHVPRSSVTSPARGTPELFCADGQAAGPETAPPALKLSTRHGCEGVNLQRSAEAEGWSVPFQHRCVLSAADGRRFLNRQRKRSCRPLCAPRPGAGPGVIPREGVRAACSRAGQSWFYSARRNGRVFCHWRGRFYSSGASPGVPDKPPRTDVPLSQSAELCLCSVQGRTFRLPPDKAGTGTYGPSVLGGQAVRRAKDPAPHREHAGRGESPRAQPSFPAARPGQSMLISAGPGEVKLSSFHLADTKLPPSRQGLLHRRLEQPQGEQAGGGCVQRHLRVLRVS